MLLSLGSEGGFWLDLLYRIDRDNIVDLIVVRLWSEEILDIVVFSDIIIDYKVLIFGLCFGLLVLFIWSLWSLELH